MPQSFSSLPVWRDMTEVWALSGLSAPLEKNLEFDVKAAFCPKFPSQPVSSQAFFQGKLKISGNMGMAMKLQNLQVTTGKAKLWDLALHGQISNLESH